MLTATGRRNLIDAKLDEHASPECPCCYCHDKFGDAVEVDRYALLAELRALTAAPYVPLASDAVADRDEHGEVDGAGW